MKRSLITTLIACPLVLLLLIQPHSNGAENKMTRTFAKLQADAENQANKKADSTKDDETADGGTGKLERATFGNGCFWCTEAVFEELIGVNRVVSGYMGGHVKNPTYEQVCSKLTGHAEVIHLEFDPSKISYARLLEVFWRTHDPTTKNQQGNDKGPQYRSAVFYHNEQQQELASMFKRKLNEERVFKKPIVTEITKASDFYAAENYHQDYFKINGRAPYCQYVIRPKMSKFRKVFADDLKQNPKNKVKRSEASTP